MSTKDIIKLNILYFIFHYKHFNVICNEQTRGSIRRSCGESKSVPRFVSNSNHQVCPLSLVAYFILYCIVILTFIMVYFINALLDFFFVFKVSQLIEVGNDFYTNLVLAVSFSYLLQNVLDFYVSRVFV